MGLIIDSSVAIAAERRGDTVAELIQRVILLADDQNAALSSVGVTELVHGIHRAQSNEIRRRRKEFVEELVLGLSVHPYTLDTARLAGRIDAEQEARGTTIPFGDLLIGATALSIGFGVLTANLRHFQLIPGLNVIAL
jgi:predicted nucleic acid-binding protein